MTVYKINRIFDVQDADQNDTDQFGLCWTPQAGNCSGVTNWIELGDAEKELWRRVNTGIDSFSITEKEKYAVRNIPGGIFYAIGNDSSPWRWPSIGIGSKSFLDGEYNRVNIIDFHKGFYNIETIPVLTSYDHLSVETHPHLFLRTYATNKLGKTYDTKAGIVYQPIWSPSGRNHAKGNITGMWAKAKYIGEKIGDIVLPPPPPPDEDTFPYNVVVRVSKTVLRQKPNISSSKIDSPALKGQTFTISEEINGWGYTGKRGWIILSDTNRV